MAIGAAARPAPRARRRWRRSWRWSAGGALRPGPAARAGRRRRRTTRRRTASRRRVAAAALGGVRPAAGRPAVPGRLAGRTRRLGLASVFYRTGALVFGGGHVVLPLLQQRDRRPRLARPGHLPGRLRRGAGPARPAVQLRGLRRRGPEVAPGGWLGGLVALVAIFLPSLLLVVGVLPFWDRLKRRPAARGRAGRRQRRGGRRAGRRAVEPGADHRHPAAQRLGAGDRRPTSSWRWPGCRPGWW